MSEAKKAGEVTAFYMIVDDIYRHSPQSKATAANPPDGDPDWPALADALDAFGDLVTFQQREDWFKALDLVASWPPELRETVRLIDALPAEATTILPDVLRGLSVKGMVPLVKQALAGEDLDIRANRLAAERIRPPMRYSKGTCPPVASGQRRLGGGCDNQVRTWEVVERSRTAGEWICRSNRLAGAASIPAETLEQMPLAEDFEPEASDLAGLAKREAQPERVWKAGTVPRVVLPGMKRIDHDGRTWIVHQQKPEAYTDDAWLCSAPNYPNIIKFGCHLNTWPLAENFPMPEDA